MFCKINKNHIIITLILIIGILLRLLFYSYHRYFWTDEAALALNILNVNNYFIPLKWGQAAPSLFMYLSKLMYNIFPQKELALRFFPLLFSIGSVFVFNKFASKYCNRFFTKVIAISSFSLSYPLIYYAQEFKQYSLDVLIFLLILLSYDYLKNLNNYKKKLFLSVFYSLALFTSFPAFFAIFVVFLNLFLFDIQQFKKCSYMLVPILLTGFLYVILFHSQIADNSLHSYWQKGFLTFNIKHDIDLITSFVEYIFSTKLIVLFFFATIFMCIKEKLCDEKYFLLYITIFLAIGLSLFNIYPLHSRVSLYLIPTIIILTIKFADFISLKNKFLEKLLLTFFCIIFILPMSNYTNNMIIKKQVWLEDFVTPLNLALNKVEKNDTIIISDGSEWLYEYYKNFYKINNPIIVEPAFNDENQYIINLNKYQKGKTYYMIYAHNRDKLKRLTTIYNWAKTKKGFDFKYDKSMNAMIRFYL